MAPLLRTTIQLLLGSIWTEAPSWSTPKQDPACLKIHNIPAGGDGPSLASISPAEGSMHVFGEDQSSGNVSHKHWDAKQWNPSGDTLEALGGNSGGPPAAISRNTSLMDIFIVDVTGNLQHKYYDGHAWQPSETDWEQLSTSTPLSQNFAPTVCSWGPNRMDVFARGSDGALYHKYYDGSSWKPDDGMENLGGVLQSGPAAVSWGPDRIDVVSVDFQNRIIHIYWDGSNWSDWEHLDVDAEDAVFQETPAAVSWGPNRFDVFAIDLNILNVVTHIYWDGTTYQNEDLGGSAFTGSVAANSWGVGRFDLVALDLGGQYWYKYFDGSNWSDWAEKGGNFTSAPSLVSWGINRLDIYGVTVSNQLAHQTWYGSGWYPEFAAWELLGGLLKAYSN